MSLTAARTRGPRLAMMDWVKASFCSLVLPGWVARTSPARTIRWVVTRVSHATRASGSFDRKASTTVSEIRSATLSGWPSETLSEVKRKEERAAKRGSCQCQPGKHIKTCLYVQVIFPSLVRRNHDVSGRAGEIRYDEAGSA